MEIAKSRSRGSKLSTPAQAPDAEDRETEANASELSAATGVASDEFEGNILFPGSKDAVGASSGKPNRKFRKISAKSLTKVGSGDDVKLAQQRAVLERHQAETANAIRDGRTTTGLRKGYGITLLAVLGGQLLIVDWIFYQFLKGNEFNVSDPVMITFLTSVVVEVIGLVAIVATSLFKRPGNAAD